MTRLGCAACGSELAGVFASCEFCALTTAETDMLRVFLASRGNLREVEKHLGVSYPTARCAVCRSAAQARAGDEPEPEPRLTRDQILAEVASGALSPDEARSLISSL